MERPNRIKKVIKYTSLYIHIAFNYGIDYDINNGLILILILILMKNAEC
jgi:hypothetical protein